MAVVGENGAGKSTVLQAAASVYRNPGRDESSRFASGFFPDTPWDRVKGASIDFSYREGDKADKGSIRKPTSRWRGNPDRPKREVEYIDLSRIQPVPARYGYSRIAQSSNKETGSSDFDAPRLARLNAIMGRDYELAKMAVSAIDDLRAVPVLSHRRAQYSGFHGGAGETTAAEFLKADLPEHGLVLIDEIETSLHPRAQRRLIRDLASICRDRDLQIILTTHSPYVLAELPLEARAHIMETAVDGRKIVYGVSPEFAMTQMDEVRQTECDLYVEDDRARVMLTEILTAHDRPNVKRFQLIACGAASVGEALGIMVAQNRFPRQSRVFLDGDHTGAYGCHRLPGDDAPERVVFKGLSSIEWAGISVRVGRDHSDVADACQAAMTLSDHHDWVRDSANRLTLSADTLWQAMCAEWAARCLSSEEAEGTVRPTQDALDGIRLDVPQPQPRAARQPRPTKVTAVATTSSTSGSAQPSELSLFDARE